MKKHLFKTFIELTGHRFSTYLLKAFTSSRLSGFLNQSFVNVYKVNIEEMEKPLYEYRSLKSLFTRRLKDGSRIVDHSSGSIVSPVDGILSYYGKVSEMDTFSVKGQDYSIQTIFGLRDKEKAFKNGSYFIFYLSPTDYHRIHSPVDGTIDEQWTCGGKSYPVNQMGMKYGDKPLATNYRLISLMNSEACKVAVIKVGALNINSIHLTHEHYTLEKGEEMAYFSFGSTVVLFIEQGDFQVDSSLTPNMKVKYGQKIGSTA